MPITLPPRYMPTGQVASGGQGTVIFCKDIHLERQVAVKILQNNEEIRRLMDELKALLLMRSKHVVQIYDIIPSADGVLGIVEEYIGGDDLMSSQRPRGSVEEYLKALFQIATGINDIHSAGLVHRDIKPNNMKFDSEGILKIFDFGLARGMGREARTVGFVGTPIFAAPELWGDGDVHFCQGVDVYAFGVTAMFLASGRFPTREEVLARDFSTATLRLPQPLIDILGACLSVNVADRPKISEVRDVLSEQLLKDKHQAIAVMERKAYFINSTLRTARINIQNVGELQIHYDGHNFIVTEISGAAHINNYAAHVGMCLPDSCVLVMSGPPPQIRKKNITFDISNPEVML